MPEAPAVCGGRPRLGNLGNLGNLGKERPGRDGAPGGAEGAGRGGGGRGGAGPQAGIMSATVAGGNGEPGERRIAASSDLHCRPEHGARMRELVKAVNAEAELLVLCGDLTDRGHPEEAKVLADALAGLSMPCAAVLGNHDLDRGAGAEIAKLLGDAGVEVLDGDHLILRDDIGVAGVKGFMGGFGSATLQAFGEGPLKALSRRP